MDSKVINSAIMLSEPDPYISQETSANKYINLGIIQSILSEIREAQSRNMHFSALYLSLALPDICSKIEYGETAKGNDYKAWVDK